MNTYRDDQLLTILQAAEVLSVSTSTVRSLVDLGRLEAVDIAPDGRSARQLRIRYAALKAFADISNNAQSSMEV